MNQPVRFSEAYRSFLNFVENDVQRERHRANRRMLSVFIWCFLMPAVVSGAFLFFIKMGVFPRKARANLDWLMLVFPVLYTLYILSSEVLAGIPSMFRRGSLASSLNQAHKDSEWRERVCDSIRTSFQYSKTEWEWVVANLKIDLESMLYRTKYLTALGGSVFFLVLQGIDSMGEDTESLWMKNPLLGWIETSNNISQLMALALFLVLLYLSGNQTYHSLLRYLKCAELVELQSEDESKS